MKEQYSVPFEEDEGYKTVQLGLREVELPVDWEIRTVSELFEIQKDSFDPSSLSKQAMVQLYSMPAYDEGKEPVKIKAGDVGSKKYRVPEDTVLFPKLNIFLKRFWRVKHNNTLPSICSTEFWPLLPKNDANLDFYYYYFYSNIFMSNPKVSLASGTDSHRRVRQGSFERAKLPYPPLDEQNKIGDILEILDREIRLSNGIIEKYKEVRIGLLQDLLLTGIDCDDVSKLNIGPKTVEVSEEWRTSYINDVINVNPRDDIPEKETFDFLPMDAIDEEFREVSYWEERDADDCTAVRFREGDTVYGKITPCAENGKIAFINDVDGKLAFGSTELLVFRAQEGEMLPKYVYYLMNHPILRSVTVSLMEGSTGRQRIPTDIFEDNLRIPVPPVNEQRRIIRVLENVDRNLRKERGYKNCLIGLKSGLMQDLLTGKVRVNTDNAD